MKYVALLAFTKIVTSHPQLVALHQDVIVECIEDPDISIRTRALELVTGMVDSNNLMPIVERLLRQLREATPASALDDPVNDRGVHEGIVPMAEEDDEEAAESLRKRKERSNQLPPLPEDYRISVIEKILEMCSRDTYTNINDFEWYVGVLVDLVRHCPATSPTADGSLTSEASKHSGGTAQTIGLEMVNVAVRVKSVRPEAVAAAQSLVLVERRQDLFPSSGNAALGVLGAAAWIVGEYHDLIPDPQAVMTSLLHSSSGQLPATVLTVYIQAVPKVFVRLTSSQQQSWTSSRKSQVSLLMARIIHFLEPLIQHPNLEVQERAVEYLELMRLASEAASAHPVENDEDGFADAPLLLTQAIPSLFMGMELNPVAAGALRKVPLTDGLDLNTPINDSLQALLQQAEYDTEAFSDEDEVSKFYFERPSAYTAPVAAANLLDPKEHQSSSYQAEERKLDPEAIEKKKAERRERYRDDPFYIDSERNSGTSTPLHNILKNSNGEELDIDSIPIMDLQLDSKENSSEEALRKKAKASRKPRKRIEIAQDETIGDDDLPEISSNAPQRLPISRAKKSLLHVDSSGLSSLSLSDNPTNGNSQLDIERRQAEEEEMRKAMQEIERVRLEMQRAQERIEAKHIPEEGTLVKRKKKKTKVAQAENADEEDAPKKKKKKKKITSEEAAGDEEKAEEEISVAAKPKKKKKRQVTYDEGEVEQ